MWLRQCRPIINTSNSTLAWTGEVQLTSASASAERGGAADYIQTMRHLIISSGRHLIKKLIYNTTVCFYICLRIISLIWYTLLWFYMFSGFNIDLGVVRWPPARSCVMLARRYLSVRSCMRLTPEDDTAYQWRFSVLFAAVSPFKVVPLLQTTNYSSFSSSLFANINK